MKTLFKAVMVAAVLIAGPFSASASSWVFKKLVDEFDDSVRYSAYIALEGVGGVMGVKLIAITCSAEHKLEAMIVPDAPLFMTMDQATAQYRIDKNPAVTVHRRDKNPATAIDEYMAEYAMFALQGEQARQFSESLRKGKQLRIKIGNWKDKFSLSNSNATISKVLKQCE